jgi:type VI secretion system Hcp family effector
MTIEVFLQFPNPADGILPKGESLDKVFKDAIVVKELSFGMEHPTTIGSTTTGAGAGKARFGEFSARKTVDRASPSLYQACGMEVRFPEGIVSIRKAGTGAGDAYLTYAFSLVFCSKIEWNGAGGDEAPYETVSFAFGAMKISYQQQGASGQLTPPSTAAWNQVTNTSAYPVAGA